MTEQPARLKRKNKNTAKKRKNLFADVTRVKRLIDGLVKDRNHLEEEVRLFNSQLKIKNVQIKQQEEEQQHAEEKINVLTKAIESISDGIFIIDAENPDFPIIYANQSFQKITGYSKNEIIGKSYAICCGAGNDSHVVEAMKQKIKQGKVFHSEMPYYGGSGEKTWILLRIVPSRNTDGRLTHFVGIQTDITLMKKEELELKSRHEELFRISMIGKLGELVSSLAHEINQPLTSILSYAQAAQRMFADRDPKLLEILQYIIDDDQRAAKVIHQLRAMLKKQTPEFELLDVNELIRDTVALVSTDIIIKNKVLKTELASELPRILGNRIQLQQVLLNLLSNGLDSMEARGDSRDLLIRTSRKNSKMISVELKDSGGGIPKQNMKNLFEHYFTTKPEGLGMGLAISRSIVEAHGGKLYAKNNPDRGATFYFTIPVGAKNTR